MGLSHAHRSGESLPSVKATATPAGFLAACQVIGTVCTLAFCLQLSLPGNAPWDALVSGAEVRPSASLHPSRGPSEEFRPWTEEFRLSPSQACPEPLASLDTHRGPGHTERDL